MGVISWAILGLIVGIIAKFLMPGKDPGGLLMTIAIGVAGAFVGGFISTSLGFGSVTGFNASSVAIATGGAMLLLLGYRLFMRKS